MDCFIFYEKKKKTDRWTSFFFIISVASFSFPFYFFDLLMPIFGLRCLMLIELLPLLGWKPHALSHFHLYFANGIENNFFYLHIRSIFNNNKKKEWERKKKKKKKLRPAKNSKRLHVMECNDFLLYLGWSIGRLNFFFFIYWNAFIFQLNNFHKW